jgi:hypothetical protein
MINLNKTWELGQECPILGTMALWVEKGVIRNGFVPSKPEVSCFIVNILFPTIAS